MTRYVPTNKRAITGDGVYTDQRYVVSCPPTSQVELMVRAMAFQGGGIIQLGPFDYTIAGTLNIVTTVTLQGVPGATKIIKIAGEGPAVRVFGGARLKDCAIERNTPASAYTADQNPTRPRENAVVHLCEPVFEFKHIEMISGNDDGWQGTVYGAATIDGCAVNCRISDTRGIYVGLYGVEADSSGSGTTLDSGYLNARVVNNTIIPLESARTVHSCIYFAAGTYTAVCLGNICRSGNQSGTTGTIKSTSANRQVALGRSSAGANSPREEANIASYSEY